jgi:hypothetical protein
MRWYEIQEDFKQALPVRARASGAIKKATPLIPAAGTPDALGAITQQVAAMLQTSATREEISDEELKQQEMLEKISNNSKENKPSMLNKEVARQEIKRIHNQRK